MSIIKLLNKFYWEKSANLGLEVWHLTGISVRAVFIALFRPSPPHVSPVQRTSHGCTLPMPWVLWAFGLWIFCLYSSAVFRGVLCLDLGFLTSCDSSAACAPAWKGAGSCRFKAIQRGAQGGSRALRLLSGRAEAPCEAKEKDTYCLSNSKVTILLSNEFGNTIFFP